MRMHIIPPWIPVAFEPVKKPSKPRKFFHAEEASESGDSGGQSIRPSSILDEDMEEKRTDILA